MVDFIDFMVSSFAQNIVGGFTSQSVQVALTIMLVIFFILMLAAGIDWMPAIVILAPGIVAASFGGSLPAVWLGVITVVLGMIWASIIMSFVK